MERLITYNCNDTEVINKISSIIKEYKSTSLSKKAWAYKKMHQNIFNVLAEKNYLNVKLGYTMYIISHMEEYNDIPYIISYKRLTDDKQIIAILFNADIKETPES